MKYYAVIDTNVLVSAMLNHTSLPGRVVTEAIAGDIIPLYNDEILAEYGDVLSRAKFKFDRGAVGLLLEAVIQRGIPVDAGPVEEMLPDPTDAVFYAVTMEKRKQGEAYLVTGNQRHFPTRSFVVTPREMVELMEKDAAEGR